MVLKTWIRSLQTSFVEAHPRDKNRSRKFGWLELVRSSQNLENRTGNESWVFPDLCALKYLIFCDFCTAYLNIQIFRISVSAPRHAWLSCLHLKMLKFPGFLCCLRPKMFDFDFVLSAPKNAHISSMFVSARINAQKFPGVFALLAPKHVQICRISVLSTPQNAWFSKISVLSAPKSAWFSRIVVLFAPKNRQHLKMHDFTGRILVLLHLKKLNFPGEQKPQPVRNFSVRNYFLTEFVLTI